jgi:hypothetical protein
LLDCPAGVLELRHELAVSQECSQPLLRRQAFYVLAQTAASSIGQLRSHALM